MGGAVSSGRDNNELIDNLMVGNYIRTRGVERVFRALDRAEYMTPESRDQAYKDLAWRNGQLHISAPCIYSEVMEGLELKPGLSFLNIGSGTGYLSTLAGLLLGSGGINHGVEVHSMVVDYANKKLSQFIENSPSLDQFDFCEPKFYLGNGLCLAPQQTPYDRVYCGAGCPEEYQNYFKQLIKVGGVLVMPLSDNLVQVRRVSATEWTSRSLLSVSFATLVAPSADQRAEPLRLEEQTPSRLQALCRCAVREALRGALVARQAELREPPPRAPPAKRACSRRICIPLDEPRDTDLGPVEDLNGLHDLDRANGGAEMNALLSLVLRMGHNRVAGALRFDPLDSDSDGADQPLRSSDYDDETDSDDHGDDDDDDRPDDDAPPAPPAPLVPDRAPSHTPGGERRALDPRSVVYFEIEDRGPRRAAAPACPPAPAAPAAPADPADKAPEDCATDKTEERTKQSRKSQDRTPKKRSSKDSKERSTDKSARCCKAASAGSRGGGGGGGGGASAEADTAEENPAKPTEVEIYLGKARGDAATAATSMEWDTAPEGKPPAPAPAPAPLSSDDETTESTSKAKGEGEGEGRQKFDSGIGEESSPTSTSASASATSSTHERDSEERCSLTEDEGTAGRRRRQKRSLCARDSSTESSCERGEGARAGAPPGAAGAPPGPGDDARRVRLSVLMKRAVRDLPLPYPMKIYLNYGRCFQV